MKTYESLAMKESPQSVTGDTDLEVTVWLKEVIIKRQLRYLVSVFICSGSMC